MLTHLPATALKPILIGMNNPVSTDSRHALYPLPAGCTGHRIWAMLHAETGATMRQYVEAFDRLDLLTGKWELKRGQKAAESLLPSLAGRTVVLLGSEVRRAFRHDATPRCADPYFMPYEGRSSVCFYQLPHPSGRNPWYRNPKNRAAAARLLASLYNATLESAR